MNQLDNGTPATPTPSVALSREAILSATSQCLAEVGYDGTTIRKIASTLNCAVGSIYRYFTDKRELLSFVCQQRFEEAAAIIESGGSVEQSISQYIDTAVESPETYRLMFWLASVGNRVATSDSMLPQIAERLIAGWGRRLNHQPSALQAWAVVHGSIMLGRSKNDILAAVRAAIDGQSAGTAPSTAGLRPIPTTSRPAPVEVAEEAAEDDEVAQPLPFRVQEEAAQAVTASVNKAGEDEDGMLLL